MKEKVLITGVAGFIGSNLAARLLKEGYAVVGIDNLSYGLLEQVPEGVQFHQIDIRSKDIYPVFKGIDYVFHLAAKTSITDCQSDPVDTADNNVVGTVNVLEAARLAGVQKVLYAETSAMYEGIDKFPTPETEVAPETFYAVSKLSTRFFAQSYYKFFGLPSVAFRYFNVYGPNQDCRRDVPPVMSAFAIRLLRGEPPIIYGDGTWRRDFIYVDDINDFHLICMKDKRADNRVFNLGRGESYSILEIYDIIADLIGKKIPPVFKPLIGSPAKLNLADISEAKSLGWVPKTNLKEGLRTMIESIKLAIAKGVVK